MWCGRENSSAVHGGNRCESTGVCRRGFVSRILTHSPTQPNPKSTILKLGPHPSRQSLEQAAPRPWSRRPRRSAAWAQECRVPAAASLPCSARAEPPTVRRGGSSDITYPQPGGMLFLMSHFHHNPYAVVCAARPFAVTPTHAHTMQDPYSLNSYRRHR